MESIHVLLMCEVRDATNRGCNDAQGFAESSYTGVPSVTILQANICQETTERSSDDALSARDTV